MNRIILLISALTISSSAISQLGLPIIGNITADAPNLGGIMNSNQAGTFGLSVDFMQDFVSADPINMAGTATELQATAAPIAAPVLIQVAPLIDAGPILPLIPPLPF